MNKTKTKPNDTGKKGLLSLSKYVKSALASQRKPIPKLRFPEFRESEAWEEKRLQDVCMKIVQGGTPDTSNADFWNGQIEWLTPSEMGKTRSRFIKSTMRKITKEGLQNCSSDLLPIHSVIISTRAPIGHLIINISRMAINQGCKGLIPKQENDYNFIYYLLISLKSSLVNLGAGNTFKELNGKTLKNFVLNVPKSKEQQKIAACLSSIDTLIEAQSQKLETLKKHKKGVMQQLFPKEGETTPKLRFPEFREAEAGEEKRLGELCKIAKSGGTPTSTNKDYYNGDIPFLTISDITSQGKYLTHTSKTVSQKGIDNSTSWIVPINTIIYSMYASVGFVSINKYPWLHHKPLST